MTASRKCTAADLPADLQSTPLLLAFSVNHADHPQLHIYLSPQPATARTATCYFSTGHELSV